MYLRIAINSLLMCANIISVQISFLWGQLWKDCVLKGTSPSQGIEICLWSMIQMNLVVFSVEGPRTFQPQASSPDLSTINFSTPKQKGTFQPQTFQPWTFQPQISQPRTFQPQVWGWKIRGWKIHGWKIRGWKVHGWKVRGWKVWGWSLGLKSPGLKCPSTVLLIFMQFWIRSHLNKLDWLTPQDV